MKLHNTKILGGFAALLVSASVLAACSSDGTDTDGTGGEGGDGPSTGGTNDGTGGEATGGTATGGETSTGGQGEGGEGGEGTGGEPPVELAVLAKVASPTLYNALNAYGTFVDADGKIYVSGVTDTGAANVTQSGADLRLAVWRLNANGSLDTTWGTGGKVTSTIVDPGTSYDIVKLSDDDGFVVHFAGSAGVHLVHLSLDGVFGTPVKIEFGWTQANRDDLETACDAAAAEQECVDYIAAQSNDGVCHTAGSAPDAVACAALLTACETTEEAVACDAAWPSVTAPLFAQRPGAYGSWGLALDTSGDEERIVVFAHGPAAKVSSGTQRTDSDRFITRVLANDFSQDEDFNGGTFFSLNVSAANLNDNSRRGLVAGDGSIVSSGYTDITDKGNHVALIRLLEDGTVDTTFGFSDDDAYARVPGQTHFNPFRVTGGFAEAYGATMLSTGALVTTGYGVSDFEEETYRNEALASDAVDLVSFRYDPSEPDGLDIAFGGNSDDNYFGSIGVQSEVDPNAGVGSPPFVERGRHVVALSDDRTVHAGAYDSAGALTVLTEDGRLDASVGDGTGVLQYQIPYNFYGLAISDDKTVIVATSATRPKEATSGSGVYARTHLAIVSVTE